MSTDNQRILPPPRVLRRRDEKYILLSDGCDEHPVFIGGRFRHNGKEYTINDINKNQIHINGKWYLKTEFEPAEVIIIKGKVKKRRRCMLR